MSGNVFKVFGKIANTLLSGFFPVLIMVLFLGAAVAAYAEEIIYTGDKNKLQEAPSWFSYEESIFCLFPGASAAPLSSGNTVTVNYNPSASDATKMDLVFGGLSKSENTSNNSVFLLKGQIAGGILGGYSDDGNAEYNTTVISDGSVGYGVIGGFSNHGSAVGNKVFLNDGAIGKDLCGGLSFSDSPGAEILDNAVTISGGYVAAFVVGGVGQGRVARNMVTISGGAVYSDVYGGHGDSHSVADNTVKITGGSVDGAVCGGFSDGEEVTGNTVIISGGLINGDVCGGYSKDGIVANNTVAVSGGFVGGRVCGGGSSDGDATNNSVTISGEPDLAKASIWGGYTDDVSGNAFTGNTLNMKSAGISVTGLDNFEYYNFYLPENLPVGGVMLSVTDEVGLSKTIVGISLQDGVKLRQGDKIALIRSAAIIIGSPKNKNCTTKQDGKLYKFSIYTDSNNLWAKVEKISNAAK